MSSVHEGPKDYNQILRNLDDAKALINEAKKAKGAEPEGYLHQAKILLKDIEKQLSQSGGYVKEHDSILEVLKKYDSIVKKYDEVYAFAATDEGIVRGGPLTKLVEKVKQGFNKFRLTVLGAKTERQLLEKVNNLLEGKVGDQTIDRKAIQQQYKELYDQFLMTGKVDPEKLKGLQNKLDLLKGQFVEFGVKTSVVFLQEKDPYRTRVFDDLPTTKPTDYDRLKPESNTFNWQGAGALRRQLTVELAKLESLQARLANMESASKSPPGGIPNFEINQEAIRMLPVSKIETTVRELRVALHAKGASREQVGRMELALKRYVEVFAEKEKELIDPKQRFTDGQIIGKEKGRVDEAIDVALANFLTFRGVKSEKNDQYLGKLTAYLVLNADDTGNQARLDKIRKRMDYLPDAYMSQFQKGFLSVIENRYTQGTPEFEQLISHLIATYDKATTGEKAVIGTFFDSSIVPLSKNASPEIVVARLTSMLKAPDGNLKATASEVMERILSLDAENISTYLKGKGARAQAEFLSALRTNVEAQLPYASPQELKKFYDVLATLNSRIDGFIPQATVKHLNSALALGIKNYIGGRFATQDLAEAEIAFAFAANFKNEFLQTYVQGLEPPNVLLRRLASDLAEAPDPANFKMALPSFVDIEKDLQRAQALFGRNKWIADLSSKLQEKKSELNRHIEAHSPWTGANVLAARLTAPGSDVGAIENEMRLAINGALSRKDLNQLQRIEADLEKMQVMENLLPHQGIFRKLSADLVDNVLKLDRDTSFEWVMSFLNTPLPTIPPGKSVDLVRGEDVRDYLIIEKHQKDLPKNFHRVRQEIAECLVSEGKKLSPEATKMLEEYLRVCKQTNRSIAQFRAAKILEKYGSLEDFATERDNEKARSFFMNNVKRPSVELAENWDKLYFANAAAGQRETLMSLLPTARFQKEESLVEIPPSLGFITVKSKFDGVVAPLLGIAAKEVNEVHGSVLEAITKELAYQGDLQGIIAELVSIEPRGEVINRAIALAKVNLELHQKGLAPLIGDETSIPQEKLNERFQEYLMSGSFRKNLIHDAELGAVFLELKNEPALATKKFSSIGLNPFAQLIPTSILNALELPFKQVVSMRMIFVNLIMEEVKQNPKLKEEFNQVLVGLIPKDVLPKDASLAQKDKAKEKFVKELAARDSVSDLAIDAHLEGFRALQERTR